jgi:predicted SPOUT superfamily RNA methylase MTH1
MSCAPWPPPKRSKPIFLFVPSSVLATEHSLELKTLKASEIARYAAMFRVDMLYVYKDKQSTRKEFELLKLLLKYTVTPPHLKRAVFPLDPRLKYAGIIRPLQTPAHIPPESPEKGAVLDVYVDSCRGGECRVYMGKLGRGVLLRSRSRRFIQGEIVTARIKSVAGDRILLEPYTPGFYWNLRVKSAHPVQDVLEVLRRKDFLIAGTSRLGECPPRDLAKAVSGYAGIALVFGGPEGHVWDSIPRKYFDVIFNTIPNQGTRTVRTEEAIAASLSLINYLLGE